MTQLHALYEKWRILSMKDGCVYKTEKIGEKWFLVGKGPETNVWVDGQCWCPTMKTKVM